MPLQSWAKYRAKKAERADVIRVEWLGNASLLPPVFDFIAELNCCQWHAIGPNDRCADDGGDNVPRRLVDRGVETHILLGYRHVALLCTPQYMPYDPRAYLWHLGYIELVFNWIAELIL